MLRSITILRFLLTTAVFLLLSGAGMRLGAQQESITVQGVITDEFDEPLPGAAVMLKGSKSGAVADVDGNYKFTFRKTAGKTSYTLEYSFLSMETKSVDVKASGTVNVSLKSDNTLEGVVVNGFYDQSKETFTGVATTIKGDDILAVSSTNLVSGLIALTPGMTTIQNNAQGSNPNAVPSILIRGANSLVTNESEEGVNNPLIVLDGVEISMEELYDLDIFDIERIDVLKDASATILYGEKGANGVIVVERKKADNAKVRFSYNFVPKFSIPDLSSYNLANAAQKLDFERLAGLYSTSDGSMDRAYDYKLQNVRRGVDTDWIHAPLRVPLSHSHSLTFSARGQNTDYRATLNVSDSYGVMKGDNRRKYAVGFQVGYHAQDKLTVTFKTNINITNAKDSPFGSYSNYVALNPYEPVYDSEGNYIKNYWFNPYDTSTDRLSNPLYDATLSSFSKSSTQSLTNSLQARWNITKAFYLTAQGNMNLGWGSTDDYTSPDAAQYEGYTDITRKGEYIFSNRSSQTYDGKLVLNYGRSLGTKGSMFRVSGGANVKYSHSQTARAAGTGFLKDELCDISFAMSYPSGSHPTGTDRIATEVGLFANANFSFRNRYFADASYRSSGSSRFGSANSFAPFWALGLGWHLHNESFLKNAKWLNTLTLRYSTGYTGSVSFDYYQAKTTYEYKSDYQYFTGIGAVPRSMGNPDLQWQKKLNNNLGITAAVLDDRFNLSFDVYSNTTFNLLMPINLPPSVGVSSMYVNFGQINNKGYDFSASGQIIRNGDWYWNVTLTGAHVMDRINNISSVLEGTQSKAVGVSDDDVITPKLLFTEGGSQFDIYAVRSAGIDPATGKEIFIKKDGSYTFTYDEDDRVAVGNSNPILTGSLMNTIRYKGLTLTFSTSYTFGSDFYNSTLQGKVENVEPKKNIDARAYTERWKSPGDLVRYLAISSTTETVNSERFIEKKNELYFSNIQITYDFSGNFIKKFGLKKLCLGIGTSDIGYISSVKYERGTSYPFCRSVNLIFRPTF